MDLPKLRSSGFVQFCDLQNGSFATKCVQNMTVGNACSCTQLLITFMQLEK